MSDRANTHGQQLQYSRKPPAILVSTLAMKRQRLMEGYTLNIFQLILSERHFRGSGTFFFVFAQDQQTHQPLRHYLLCSISTVCLVWIHDPVNLSHALGENVLQIFVVYRVFFYYFIFRALPYVVERPERSVGPKTAVPRAHSGKTKYERRTSEKVVDRPQHRGLCWSKKRGSLTSTVV